jgi:hypothetical protein
MRLPPPSEVIGWSDPAYSIYGTLVSLDYVSSNTLASSAISQGAEPKSWREACAPIAWYIRRRQRIALLPDSARRYRLHQESTCQCFPRQAALGDNTHVRKVLSNALSIRSHQALLFTPGEHSPMPSSPGTHRSYHLHSESTHQCSLHQAHSKNITHLRRALANALSAASVDITHIWKPLANALFAHLRQMN